MSEKNRRNKEWNKMEKDLFLKGLELFGENWRKISEFITTKTLNQVKLYHNEWVKTANVVPDSANLGEDPCVYLRSDFTVKEQSIPDLGCEEVLSMNPRECNESQGIGACSSEPNTYSSGINFTVDGIVVSSLHDWNLGSQVSITDEASSEDSFFNLEPWDIVCEEGDTSKKILNPMDMDGEVKNTKKINKRKSPKDNLSKIKKDKNSKAKGKSKKKFASTAKKAKLKLAKKDTVNAAVITEGEIIRLNKDDSENSDVDIDDSDQEESFELFKEQNTKTSHARGNDQIKVTPLCDSDTLGLSINNISDSEKLFYAEALKFEGREDLATYLSIRSEIIKEWEICRPLFVSKGKLVDKLNKFNSDIVCKIYNYLGNNGMINLSSKEPIPVVNKKEKRVLPKRNRNGRSSAWRRSTDVIKKGGGITMSHDSSGAVIKTLHIPESPRRSNDAKKNSSLQPLKLLNCLKHDPDSPAPFSALIYPQAVITLDMHSHSSYSEVIGLLGGFLDHSKHTLHITVAIPTKASSSKIECEMCPLSQMEAFEQISELGMEVIGWYHSHPCFLPNPSQKDCDTQAQLQHWFKKRAAPFVGIILSPFCHSDNDASVIRCFILDSPPSKYTGELRQDNVEVDVPYRISWSVLDHSDWTVDEVKKIIHCVLQKSKGSSNPVKWEEEWKREVSYLDKLILSLELILPLDLKELVSVVREFLLESIQNQTKAHMADSSFSVGSDLFVI